MSDKWHTYGKLDVKESDRLMQKLRNSKEPLSDQVPFGLDAKDFLRPDEADRMRRAIEGAAERCIAADPSLGGYPPESSEKLRKARQLYNFRLSADIYTHMAMDHPESELRDIIVTSKPFVCALCGYAIDAFAVPGEQGCPRPHWETIALYDGDTGHAKKGFEAIAKEIEELDGIKYNTPPCTCDDPNCKEKFHKIIGLKELLIPLRNKKSEVDLTRPPLKVVDEPPKPADKSSIEQVNKFFDDWRSFELPLDNTSIRYCAVSNINDTLTKKPDYFDRYPNPEAKCTCAECVIFSPTSHRSDGSRRDPLDVPSRILFVSREVFGPRMKMPGALQYTRKKIQRDPQPRERIMIIHEDLLYNILKRTELQQLLSWACTNALLCPITLFQFVTLLRLTGPNPLRPIDEAVKNVGEVKKMWNVCYCGCYAYGPMTECAMKDCLSQHFHIYCIRSDGSLWAAVVQAAQMAEETEEGREWFCAGCERKLKEKVAREF